MYSLEVICAMNRNTSGLKAESETTRHCSFVKSNRGVVLHSAIHRNTVFLKPGGAMNEFLRQMADLDPAVHEDNVRRRDIVIERYFN